MENEFENSQNTEATDEAEEVITNDTASVEEDVSATDELNEDSGYTINPNGNEGEYHYVFGNGERKDYVNNSSNGYGNTNTNPNNTAYGTNYNSGANAGNGYGTNYNRGYNGGYNANNAGYGGMPQRGMGMTPPPPPPYGKKPKKPMGAGKVIAIALIVALLTSTVFSGAIISFWKLREGDADVTTSATENQKITIDGDIEEIAQAAYAKASPSVVGIETSVAVDSYFDIFGEGGEEQSGGTGSGVIYKSNGYIITNYHVIADTLDSDDSVITVYLNNDVTKGVEAKVINYNISCDLAVLKVDKTGLNAIEVADKDSLKVGQFAIAIGSPGGLDFIGSTSFGIISGLDRKMSTTSGEVGLVQTDAAINPGNSGGALVNSKGELIGISSSKLVAEQYEGMGFAIPIKNVVEVCDDLIAHEGEGEPYIGVSISSNYTAEVLKYYGYPVGAVIADVDEGSPAQKAGLKRGDIVTKFGSTAITEYDKLVSAVNNCHVGDKVKVKLYRGGKYYTTTITIAAGN